MHVCGFARRETRDARALSEKKAPRATFMSRRAMPRRRAQQERYLWRMPVVEDPARATDGAVAMLTIRYRAPESRPAFAPKRQRWRRYAARRWQRFASYVMPARRAAARNRCYVTACCLRLLSFTLPAASMPDLCRALLLIWRLQRCRCRAQRARRLLLHLLSSAPRRARRAGRRHFH